MHGRVETTANQIIFDLLLEKRLFGTSTIAQKVTGIVIITTKISKFTGSKLIRLLQPSYWSTAPTLLGHCIRYIVECGNDKEKLTIYP